uniref:Uncharacterized protein n=1 Tax=Pararge aegeria TaxID=116150 RepID=S4NW61_9NEOP
MTCHFNAITLVEYVRRSFSLTQLGTAKLPFSPSNIPKNLLIVLKVIFLRCLRISVTRKIPSKENILPIYIFKHLI